MSDITEKDILMACRYAIGKMLERGSVEYIRKCDGKWCRTSWFDVVDEINNRLSKIEAEGDSDNG